MRKKKSTKSQRFKSKGKTAPAKKSAAPSFSRPKTKPLEETQGSPVIVPEPSPSEPLVSQSKNQDITAEAEDEYIGNNQIPHISGTDSVHSIGKSRVRAQRASSEEGVSEALSRLRRSAWKIPSLRNPLTEPLRSRVEQAQDAQALMSLLPTGRIDDDLEIAYRVSKHDTLLGSSALATALASSGGAASLRRRAWAAIGDIHLANGDLEKARIAYNNALSGQ